MYVRDDTATLHPVVGIAYRDADNVLQTVKSAYIRDAGNTRRTVFGSLSVNVSPSHLLATGYGAGTVTPWTPFCTATPTEGTAPYTYSWSASDGWGILNPTSASTSFQSAGVDPGESSSATATVTVTDANGLIATGGVSLDSFNSHPGGF